MRKFHYWTAILILALVPASACADPTLDFNIAAPTAGSISYAGGLASLFGTNIQVDSVTCLDCPLNNNVTLTIIGGLLNFQSGASDGTWSWGSGGTLTLTGAITSVTSGDAALITNGQFGTASVTGFGNAFNIAGSGFSDNKNPDLLAYFGLGAYSGITWGGNFNISFDTATTQTAGTAFTSTKVLSGDVTNVVPEPASLSLFGTGLLALAGVVRRKVRHHTGL